MKQIRLTKGKFALVDDEDYDFLMSIGGWYYSQKGYAEGAKKKKRSSGEKGSIHYSMHRLIMKTPKGMMTDHIDGNPLNNQKANLRICTNAENQRNKKLPKSNTSGFRGVYWSRSNKKWLSRITVNRHMKYLGGFDCKIEAAKVYNEAAIMYFGEFAQLNEMPG